MLIEANDSIFAYNILSSQSKTIAPYPRSSVWRRVTWSPDEKFISAILEQYALGSTTSLTIWKNDNPIDSKKIVVAETSEIGDIFWTANSSRLVYSEFGSIHIVDIKTMRDVSTLKTNDADAVKFVSSPDQKLIACKDDDSLLVLDADQITTKYKIQGDDRGQFQLAWNPNGRLLLLKSKDGVAIFDTSTGLYLAHRHFKDLLRASWSEDGKEISLCASGTLDPDTIIKLKKTRDGKIVFTNAAAGAPRWATPIKPKNVTESIQFLNKILTPAAILSFKNIHEDQISSYCANIMPKPLLPRHLDD